MASGRGTKIGILATGAPPAGLEQRFGSYPDMFRELLGEGYAVTSYDVVGGACPAAPENEEAYIVTGSAAGTYEDQEWIHRLKAFLRTAKGKAKLVGICFGHQIMAEAFGGKLVKSEMGWGIGLHRYEVRQSASWMDKVPSFTIPVSHQDQIVVQPPGTRVLAASRFTPFGLLAYEDQPAISFQGHPEFEPAYAGALIELRRARLPDPEAALASLREPNDRPLVARWIRRFLEGAGTNT